ncbi:hypothetical protein EMIHUDRAFT_241475, partial [Emiliania huxleyi CCMP1516]|uniref:Protein kinase domain-containing protein n=2 Tax=Emiliania huxleyi TaxID=2903 RepID=A0A0D3JCI4_EMIH1
MQLLSELGGHRNVVRFLGACLDAQRMFILLELCPSSLSDRLYKEDTDLNEHEMLVVALGLYYLHHCEPPVLHLDLKSANVLLDESGTAKVCDFGPFHSMEDAANRFDPAERSGIGSPQWIAPEILRGGRSDVKADSYSFGVLLYEVLARQLPYAGQDTSTIIIGVITRMLERPALEPADAARWPECLPELMEECLREAPGERPDVEDLIDMLELIAPEAAESSRAAAESSRAAGDTEEIR